jgi:DNA-binding transcriptional LysR family regulator
MPMDWDKLRIFHAVARAGSFTHAGEELNLSQSAVSRQISALEEDLGVQLFHRHARGLILTEQGETLGDTARDVFERLSLAQVQIADSKAVPSGDLRVTSTVGFGSTWLTPRMREFIELYPDINLSLICDDREMDLGMREADVAIRFADPTQPDLVKRRLFTIRNHIYASDEYLASHPPIATIEDLDGHNIIAYGDNAPPSLRNVNWIRNYGLKGRALRPVALQVNNIYGLLLSVEAGMGIASLPDYMVKGHPKLRQILPEVKGPAFDSYFVYPEELRNMKRLNVFRDFLLVKVKEWQNDVSTR